MEKLTEAIRLLRESFSAARNDGQEQVYGLSTQPWTIATHGQGKRLTRMLLPAHRIIWRNYATGEWGDLAITEAKEVVPVLMALLNELTRLRKMRRAMKKAA